MVHTHSSRRGCKPPPARTVLSLFSTTRSPDTPAVAQSTRSSRKIPTSLASCSGSSMFPQTEPHVKIEGRETAFQRRVKSRFLPSSGTTPEGLGLGVCCQDMGPLLHFCPLVKHLRTEPSCRLTAGLHCSRYAGKHAQNAQFQRHALGNLRGRLRCDDHRQSASTASFQLQLPVARPRRQSWRLRTVSRRQSLERRYFFRASGS